VLVPESHVELGLTSSAPLNASIYPNRDTALADIAATSSGSGHAGYAYYRGVGGPLIVPTVFSPAAATTWSTRHPTRAVARVTSHAPRPTTPTRKSSS
jgi:hypothetical protein